MKSGFRIISSLLIFYTAIPFSIYAQEGSCVILKAQHLFDGEKMHSQPSAVLVDGEKIKYAGPESDILVPSECKVLDFGDATIMPGMIEGHAHLLLHPYNEVSWNDQVLKESHAERAIRGAVHANATLMAGFTTVRDLGSEGADNVDVGLKQSIEKGIIPGPRLIVAGKAIVSTGSYGPKGFHEYVNVPLGAEVADGYDQLIKVIRDQIGKGSDIIKVYADYRWGPNNEAQPTFTQKELDLIVEIAKSSGRDVVAHAATAEGMRRATLAGVSTIEHGDGGTVEVFELMKENGVALCPTLAAGEAILQYSGWIKGLGQEPERIKNKKASFKLAMKVGVTIVAGGDVGVFTHGDNVRELEMMVEYGMSVEAVLKSVTSGNADVFRLTSEIGRLQKGLTADIIVVSGNPINNISLLREIELIMKDGKIYP